MRSQATTHSHESDSNRHQLEQFIKWWCAVNPLATQLAREARRGGLSVNDMIAAFNELNDNTHERTIREHVELVAERLANGTKGTYKAYLERLVDMFGDSRVVDITVTDLHAFTKDVINSRVKRRNSNDGRLPENCVGALRCVFSSAVDEGLRSDNPALKIEKPRRVAKEPRRALTRAEIIELVNVTRRDSNDADLDVLIMRFVLETGCRREGVLNLTDDDIDVNNNQVRLNEKGGVVRWQPVTAELVVELLAHMNSRPTDRGVNKVFRNQLQGKQAFHRPVTRKRIEALTAVWSQALPWVQQQGVSLHWLRHTTITNIDRLAGPSVAQGFAGHQPSSVTGRYTVARPHEIQEAFDIYVGLEPSDSDQHVLPLCVFRRNYDRAEVENTSETGCTEPETVRNSLHGRNTDSVSITKCSVQANTL